MEAREALAALEPLKNTFKSLENLAEILETAARIEGQVGQLETAKIRLGREIESLKQKRDDVEEEFKTFEIEQMANRERVRDKVNAEIAEFRNKAKNEQDKLSAKLDELTQTVDRMVSNNARLKSEMDAEIEERHGKLRELNELIDATRARLKGIG